MTRFISTSVVFAFFCFYSVAWASSLDVPNTFQSGEQAVAQEVNNNFTAVETAVNDNDARIAALEALVTTLQSQLVGMADQVSTLQAELSATSSTITSLQNDLQIVQENSVLELDTYLSLVTDDDGVPTASFSAVNVNINNGEGNTATTNGSGNLIVGYNELKTFGTFVCSDGQYENQQLCEAGGAIWSRNHRSGSHNIVAGARNGYSSYGGLVVGDTNAITARFASISGGAGNLARAQVTSISGGANNTANGNGASVSGGFLNVANGERSSVSGGYENIVDGPFGSISGGGSRHIEIDRSFWWRAGPFYTDNLSPRADTTIVIDVD